MDKKAIIITAEGYDEREFYYAYYRLQEAGFVVDVATSENDMVYGKHKIPFEPTIRLNQLTCNDYDLLVIPGGYVAPDKMRQNEKILEFVRLMDDQKKIISSTCHGPWVLISAGIMKGRRATCYAGCKDDMINAGAEYSDESVVIDGNVVTAQHYRNNPEWMKETLRLFNK